MSRWLDVALPKEADALSASGRARLTEEARREVLRRSYGGMFAYPLLFVALGILNDDFAARPVVIVGVVVASLAIVAARVLLYRRATARAPAFSRAAQGHLVLGIGLAMMMSIYASSVFVRDGGSAGSFAGFITGAGVAAMLVTIACIRKRLALVWIWAALTPAIATMLWHGETTGYGLGLMFAYFGGILTSAVDKSHRAYWRAQLSGALLDQRAQEVAALSREAGMAEVATNVLHDVGNTLNSVTTTVSELVELHRRDPSADLERIASVLDDMPRGLDPRVVQFVHALAEDAALRQADVSAELGRLAKHTQHLERVVRRQQDIAGPSGAAEACDAHELVVDAMALLGLTRGSGSADVLNCVPAGLTVWVDRHRALQILVNLIKNATEATEGLAGGRVLLDACSRGGGVDIEITDNGQGADPATVAKVFTRGFTTKAHGHGFGLHGAAATARAMGGSLDFHSDGRGRGARVTVSFAASPRAGASAETQAQRSEVPDRRARHAA